MKYHRLCAELKSLKVHPKDKRVVIRTKNGQTASWMGAIYLGVTAFPDVRRIDVITFHDGTDYVTDSHRLTESGEWESIDMKWTPREKTAKLTPAPTFNLCPLQVFDGHELKKGHELN